MSIINKIFITLLSITVSNYSWSSLLDGEYELTMPTDCIISITISDNHYVSVVNSSKSNGKIIENKEHDKNIIKFFKWKGDTTNEDITARYEDSMLFIQNYGNAMNEYTKLEECGEKYLVLKKKNS